ncbi:MAG: hypothetical protein D8M57_17880 [Candidatus Scalindua sp. AMX11]|nr:MAG: hypothetical protein DWQ00_00380 [Candidatus Scalindua sp.]NOG83242.1 hypothetical protein [Planctomycetota bacterium]TDE63505.1 MAG: hypothetical protein D8M57_17880 [Candidatus Scalindua sp. AMX11]GJQ58672.1 MAG: hypothetical protein SCALA701_14730 [Candidatus Scalindua sp.]
MFETEGAIKKQQEVIISLKNKIESKERVVYNSVSDIEMSEFWRVTPKNNFSWESGSEQLK